MNQFYQRTNILPPQQILQANGKSSIDLIQMSPNSSVLIADTTAPIVWRCVSDGLGNVTAEPFDISPHKDEQEIQRENFEQRLAKLEEFIYGLQSNSFTSTDTGYVTDDADVEIGTKSASITNADGTKQPSGKKRA